MPIPAIESAATPALPSIEPSPRTPEPDRSLRILIVEGDALYRQLLGRTLEHSGWLTDIAETADAAVAAFERSRYAMVVVGTDGLRLDGFEVARRIREIEKPGIRTPIVALTGDILQLDRKKRKAAGIDNFIAKPIRRQSLMSILARYTESAAPHEEPTRPLAAIDERCISDLSSIRGLRFQ